MNATGSAIRTMVRAAVTMVIFAAELLAASPKTTPPTELIGPIPPSIYVPPVRVAPPARTELLVQPPQYDPKVKAWKRQLPYRMESLRLAITDLIATFGDTYPDGNRFLRRWKTLSQTVSAGAPGVEQRFRQLRNDALLANPLIDFQQLLVLKRKRGQLGLPTNHQCNACLRQDGYDNELAILSPVKPDGRLQTLYRPEHRWYVGEMDLNYDASRLLFTMPNGRTWQIHEIGIDGRGLRQVSHEIPDVDNFDACYLPDGRIVFGSTASFTGVPCWHGRERACCLYTMNADGSGVRQLCYDQDLDLHPSVLTSGQVIFSRWDYTGILHAYVRPLMVMNPDGTGQRAIYGSNSYYPNCLFFPRAVPGLPTTVVTILAGYHGKNRMGELLVLDTARGAASDMGIVHRITHRGEPIVPVALDRLTEQATPQFLHPYPLSDKYILTAMQPEPNRPWGIYLVDIFDNIVPVLTDTKYDFFEPYPIKKRRRPPVITDRTDPTEDSAVVVVNDVYQGQGLKGVPRGVIKRLRVAAYHFGFPGMAGPDKIGHGGPWEVIRILGTVPVYDDGSAKFRVPANTPITLQALDAEGKAVQLMRSWYTAMPGETTSCVGCHETPADAPILRAGIAQSQPVSEIKPWYGPARGFDFAREVQPVLDQYCVVCHDGQPHDGQPPIPDLRKKQLVKNYIGLPLSRLGATRLDPELKQRYADQFRSCNGLPKPFGNLRTLYTPAYEALIPFIRRVNIEDAASLLRPGEYHADTSALIQMLQKGHHGVKLDEEAWDRLITWIDLNGPCFGTWGEVAEIPKHAGQRRHELALATGGPRIDPEVVPVSLPAESKPPVIPAADRPTRHERLAEIARVVDSLSRPPARETPKIRKSRTLHWMGDQAIELVWIPAGRFVMGDRTGEGDADEWPPSVVDIARGFWISRTEVTNAQFRSIFPEHSSGVFTKRQINRDGPGIQLDAPNQPAVRVSWNEAMAFCHALSTLTGSDVTLPTEAQWEYAARAGTTSALCYGEVAADFSQWANMADRSLSCLYQGTAGVAALQPIPAILNCDDQAIATADVASYRPNAWGLYDVHGNAAEWTRSIYQPYPYDAQDGRNLLKSRGLTEKRVVRGGSYYDRPKRCRSACRRAFPAWQAVHDVGFRITLQDVAVE